MNLWAVWHKSSGLGDLMEKNMGKMMEREREDTLVWDLAPLGPYHLRQKKELGKKSLQALKVLFIMTLVCSKNLHGFIKKIK